MAHVASLFTSIDFWRLRPAPEAIANQPGHTTPAHFIAAGISETRALLVAYTPGPRTIELRAGMVPKGPSTWHDPRTGARTRAAGVRADTVVRFDTPADGDWALVIGR
jgi:hypothetical protein